MSSAVEEEKVAEGEDKLLSSSRVKQMSRSVLWEAPNPEWLSKAVSS